MTEEHDPNPAAERRIKTALDRIEALWDASLFPDKIVVSGLPTAEEGSRPPIPIGGISLRADITRRLHYWANLAITQAGGLPSFKNLSDLSALAATRWYAAWLAQDDPQTGRDGNYLADELEEFADKVAAHTLPIQPGPDNEVGICPACQAGTLVKSALSELLHCSSCGERAEAWLWWERRYPDLQADVTQQEIAVSYGVPVGTVKTWIRRRAIPAITPPATRPIRYRWAQVRWLVEYRDTRAA